MNVFAGFAVVVFCLIAAGVLAATPIWIYAALAGVAASLLFAKFDW